MLDTMTSETLTPLLPDTAAERQSIWAGIDRINFDRKISSLTSYVPGRIRYNHSQWAANSQGYPISFGAELDLADAFAFIASSEPTVDCVSAAALEMNAEGTECKVVISANEGLKPVVRKALDSIFGTLRKRATRDISRHECSMELFDKIVELCSNKISGRLGSRWFCSPGAHCPNRGPLPRRLRNLLMKRMTTFSRGKPLFEQLLSELEEIEARFDRLEIAAESEHVEQMQAVIRQVHSFSRNGTGLIARLKTFGISESDLDNREVREVGKVANYWHICRALTLLARKYRPLFMNIGWTPLAKYRPSRSSTVIPRKFVHAEIQVLVHYETYDCPLRPRAIGVSKEACFLCDSFIHAHGRYKISGAHRQTFAQWTIPDLDEYKTSTVTTFRRSLSQVERDVETQYQKSQKQRNFRPFPLQSAINLNAPHISSAPTSTCQSSSSNSGHRSASITSQVPLAISIDGERSEVKVVPEVEDSTSTTSKLIAGGSIMAMRSQPPGSEIAESIPSEPEILEYDKWLHLYISSLAVSKGLGGQVQLEATPDNNNCQIIDSSDIPFNNELHLYRNIGDERDELAFVLKQSDQHRVWIRCKWY